MPRLLQFVLALMGWMVLSMVSPAEGLLLAPGLAVFMACLSVVLWERVVAPAEARLRRTPAPSFTSLDDAPLWPAPRPGGPAWARLDTWPAPAPHRAGGARPPRLRRRWSTTAPLF